MGWVIWGVDDRTENRLVNSLPLKSKRYSGCVICKGVLKMPVFHTKTIESILDPVAQQVSLVLQRTVDSFTCQLSNTKTTPIPWYPLSRVWKDVPRYLECVNILIKFTKCVILLHQNNPPEKFCWDSFSCSLAVVDRHSTRDRQKIFQGWNF